jgi:hypothetical protein
MLRVARGTYVAPVSSRLGTRPPAPETVIKSMAVAIQGKGKSGGVRVIYFYVTTAAQIRLIAIYKKGIKDDLNAAEEKSLKKLNDNW